MNQLLSSYDESSSPFDSAVKARDSSDSSDPDPMSTVWYANLKAKALRLQQKEAEQNKKTFDDVSAVLQNYLIADFVQKSSIAQGSGLLALAKELLIKRRLTREKIIEGCETKLSNVEETCSRSAGTHDINQNAFSMPSHMQLLSPTLVVKTCTGAMHKENASSESQPASPQPASPQPVSPQPPSPQTTSIQPVSLRSESPVQHPSINRIEKDANAEQIREKLLKCCPLPRYTAEGM